MTRRFFAATPAQTIEPGPDSRLVLTMAKRVDSETPLRNVHSGVGWVLAASDTLAYPFPQEIQVGGAVDACVGMVFSTNAGDTILWSVETQGWEGLFHVTQSENNPGLLVIITGGSSGEFSAKATVNGTPAGALKIIKHRGERVDVDPERRGTGRASPSARVRGRRPVDSQSTVTLPASAIASSMSVCGAASVRTLRRVLSPTPQHLACNAEPSRKSLRLPFQLARPVAVFFGTIKGVGENRLHKAYTEGEGGKQKTENCNSVNLLSNRAGLMQVLPRSVIMN